MTGLRFNADGEPTFDGTPVKDLVNRAERRGWLKRALPPQLVDVNAPATQPVTTEMPDEPAEG